MITLRPFVPDFVDDTALCAQSDPELWFPDKGDSVTDAKRICVECPLRQQCLAWALRIETEAPELFGIWGGLTARERRKLRPRKAPGPKRDPSPCGTTAAARRHGRRGEPVCDACRGATADAARARRAAS